MGRAKLSPSTCPELKAIIDTRIKSYDDADRDYHSEITRINDLVVRARDTLLCTKQAAWDKYLQDRNDLYKAKGITNDDETLVS